MRLRTPPAALATLALLLVVPLALWNLVPRAFPDRAHDLLGATPLALVAAGYLWHRLSARPSRRQALQALMLATGFALWAATQLWPESTNALVLNDIAIGLFVAELFLVITGRPVPGATRSST